MIRLGLKLTHDGGLAVLDGSELITSHEAEKSSNLPRHAPLSALDVAQTLGEYGLSLGDVDRVIVDGWIDGRTDVLERGVLREIAVAPYHETPLHRDPLAPMTLRDLPLAGTTVDYLSFTHAAGHLCGTFATSPWAAAGRSALVLVWDGAMLPRLYLFDPSGPSCTPIRQLFGFLGHVYPVFGSFFGPFAPAGEPASHDSLPKQTLLDLSGKVMAWIGLGRVDDSLFAAFDRVYKEKLQLNYQFVFDFARTVATRTRELGVPDEDVVASFQAWVGEKLVGALAAVLCRTPSLPRRLCFTGGCALNIAWNARLRASGLFEDVWVPPFPNDAGSALGTAAADLIRSGEAGSAIAWDVYRGPPLLPGPAEPGWRAAPSAIPELAAFLHESGEPVVFLHGRAELGPRALGNRSILCSAVRPETKEMLNEMKLREWYRPVAPICLEEDAARVFDPGSPDPYMLFMHAVRAEWRKRVPAIVHLDGSARLQTIREDQNPVVARLLAEYRDLSGVPLLCNTSANLKGSGFFPDLRSALQWPAARHVWCDGVRYSRVEVAAPG